MKVAAVPVALLLACGDGSPAAPDAAPGHRQGEADAAAPAIDAAPPAGDLVRVEGTADATAPGGDVRVECTFFADLLIEDRSPAGFSGVALGGEVFRRAFAGDAPLFEFQALIGGPASLAVTADGVELRVAGDQPRDAPPFWLALEVLAGAATSATSYEGEWTCAPVLGADAELEDPQLEAPGRWTLAPLAR